MIDIVSPKVLAPTLVYICLVLSHKLSTLSTAFAGSIMSLLILKIIFKSSLNRVDAVVPPLLFICLHRVVFLFPFIFAFIRCFL